MGLQNGEILAPALMVFVWDWSCRRLAVLSYSSSRLSARLGADKRPSSSKCSLITSVTCASTGSSLTTPSFFLFLPFLNDQLQSFFFDLLFVISVLICCGRLGCVGGDKALFSTIRANAASPRHPHWKARGHNKKKKICWKWDRSGTCIDRK